MVESTATQVLRGDGERVLVVDDEEQVLMVASLLLEKLGYRVTAMVSSVEALRYFEQNTESIDLLLTDMTMPGLTGLQLSREALKIKPELPIILCTGFSETINEKKAKAEGVREFLLKPIGKMDFAKAIRKALGRPAP